MGGSPTEVLAAVFQKYFLYSDRCFFAPVFTSLILGFQLLFAAKNPRYFMESTSSINASFSAPVSSQIKPSYCKKMRDCIIRIWNCVKSFFKNCFCPASRHQAPPVAQGATSYRPAPIFLK